MMNMFGMNKNTPSNQRTNIIPGVNSSGSNGSTGALYEILFGGVIVVIIFMTFIFI